MGQPAVHIRGISSGVLILLAIGAIHWFALEARWAKPRSMHGYTEYPMPLGLEVVFSAAIPLLLYGSIENWLRPHSEKWVSMLLATMALFCLYFAPPTILCSPERLVSIRWYGIKKVSMKWSDVSSVYLNPEDNSVIIRDERGQTIIHTAYNIGRSQFLSQISVSLPILYKWCRPPPYLSLILQVLISNCVTVVFRRGLGMNLRGDTTQSRSPNKKAPLTRAGLL